MIEPFWCLDSPLDDLSAAYELAPDRSLPETLPGRVGSSRPQQSASHNPPARVLPALPPNAGSVCLGSTVAGSI